MGIHDERVKFLHIIYILLSIDKKGDFLVKLSIKCSTLKSFWCFRNITMYIFDRIMDLIIPHN